MDEASAAAGAREPSRYLTFPQLPKGTLINGKPALNRYSAGITQGHDYPGAQVSEV